MYAANSSGPCGPAEPFSVALEHRGKTMFSGISGCSAVLIEGNTLGLKIFR